MRARLRRPDPSWSPTCSSPDGAFGRRLRAAEQEKAAPREALDEPVVRADTDLLIGRPELQTLAITAGLSRATFFRAFAGTSGTGKRAKEATP